jgi:NodT family efflux transporter outer membrane factor (OMF) lipoprotein
VAEADRQAARLALSTALARGWFQLQRQASLRAVTEQAIRQRTDVLALAQQRFDAGLDTNAELRQAEALLPAARVDLAQIDESIGLVRNQIAALLGKGPDRGREIGVPQGVASVIVALPASLPAELVGRRPDIVAARWRVEAARGQIAQARAEFYPNIDLVASAGLIALGTSQFVKTGSRNWSGGPALTLPIFEGGRLRAGLAGRNADYDAAVEQYNSAVVDAVKDVADQVIAMQSVNAQLDDQRLARIRTEEAYDVAVTRYRAGLSTYLTVLNAQTSVLQQERADAELRARILDVNVALVRALGGGYRANEDDAPIAARSSSR